MSKICKFLTLIILIVVVLLFGIFSIAPSFKQRFTRRILNIFWQPMNRSTGPLRCLRNATGMSCLTGMNICSVYQMLRILKRYGMILQTGKTTGNTVISICLTNTVIFLQPTTGKALQTVSGTVFRKCTAPNAPLFLTILPAAANTRSSLRFR